MRTLPAMLYAGLAVTSHRPGTLCNATFDQVAISGATKHDHAACEHDRCAVGFARRRGEFVVDSLIWADHSDNETGFEIERASDGANFVSITTAADATSYTDQGLASGVTYSYRVARATTWISRLTRTSPRLRSAMPSRGFHADIGDVGVAGSDDADPATLSITVRAPVATCGATPTHFHFVYQQRTGDTLVEAQVSAMDNTNDWAKAGVMIRASAAADAPMPSSTSRLPGGTHAQARTAWCREHQRRRPWWVGAPYWVPPRPHGGHLCCIGPPDGANWSVRRELHHHNGRRRAGWPSRHAHDNTPAQHRRVRRAIYPLTALLAVRYRSRDPPP